MPTKEMLIVLSTLDTIKRRGTMLQSHASDMGYLTFEEVQVFQQIAEREGTLGQIVSSILNILEKTEDHPDLPTDLATVAGIFWRGVCSCQSHSKEGSFLLVTKSACVFQVRDWYIWER